ncbi:hypothetical protein LINGRAHAP2_LOCUS459 [Linum grandiflorum]
MVCALLGIWDSGVLIFRLIPLWLSPISRAQVWVICGINLVSKTLNNFLLETGELLCLILIEKGTAWRTFLPIMDIPSRLECT